MSRISVVPPRRITPTWIGRVGLRRSTLALIEVLLLVLGAEDMVLGAEDMVLIEC